ncbi:MAG: ubiquinol-cytochrome C chaperone family protein [Acidobacteriota bacterium]
MVFSALLSRRARRQREAAAELYRAVVAQARDPIFYRELEVPDSLDGRFEVVALHAFLVLNRLKADGAATAELAQALFDTFFEDMDRSLREMGAGDLGVGRRVKAMAQGFYGRIRAYELGLGGGETALADALRRNLWGTVPAPADLHVAALSRYLKRQHAALAAQPVAAFAAGRVAFLTVAAGTEGS